MPSFLNKTLLVISCISLLVAFFSACIGFSDKRAHDPRGTAYAGEKACLQCHQSIYQDQLHGAHANASWRVDSMPHVGMFSGQRFVYNDSSWVVLEKRDSGFFQVAYVNGREMQAHRFDIGFGSGEKAFSFGYWQDKKLYQLPLSYFEGVQAWANSPGFTTRYANFRRPIIRRCFECHSSFVAEHNEQVEGLTSTRNLDSATVIYGIDCERCHGPGADHVEFHTKNPSEKEAHAITQWRSLTRQQKLDACGVCHSGNDLETERTTFAFQPGDTLSHFYYPEFGVGFSSQPDVHGKQVQLLSASRCFTQSRSLECSSCHSPHVATVPAVSVYAQQCINCHNPNMHPQKAALGDALVDKCIDCHMPQQVSKAISFQLMGKDSVNEYLLRTHRIAVYAAETEKIKAELGMQNR